MYAAFDPVEIRGWGPFHSIGAATEFLNDMDSWCVVWTYADIKAHRIPVFDPVTGQRWSRPWSRNPRAWTPQTPSAKLTEEDVRSMRQRHNRGEVSVAALAREYDICYFAAHNAVMRRTWKKVS